MTHICTHGERIVYIKFSTEKDKLNKKDKVYVLYNMI